jgi:hypothetical protein
MRPAEVITREEFLSDRHGKTFADVVHDARTPFDEVREFFNDADRQQRMEDSEIHHDRAPLAGVVRELESEPAVHRFFAMRQRRRSARLRQAIGVLVRMIMERRGWQTTGKKGSLGVRGSPELRSPYHNIGGLALWFIRAERYQCEGAMRFRTVRERCEEFVVADSSEATGGVPAAEEGVPRSRRNGPVS